MKVRPIIMSAPMVLALLDGRKTQTRRILKRQPPDEFQVGDVAAITNGRGRWAISRCLHPGTRKGMAWPPDPEPGFLCPYGGFGDALYVRESWAEVGSTDPGLIVYRADYPDCVPAIEETGARWRPSIHMPRVHSRLTLIVRRSRLERLHDISEHDAKAEGVQRAVDLVAGRGAFGLRNPEPGTYRDGFRTLWNDIHGPEAWTRNPWVWAVEFEVFRLNVDDVVGLLP